MKKNSLPVAALLTALLFGSLSLSSSLVAQPAPAAAAAPAAPAAAAPEKAAPPAAPATTPAIPPTPAMPPGAPNPHGAAVAPEKIAENAALKFETTHRDFGEVKEGEEVPVIFPFVNKSEKVVHITEVRPSCGCTTASDNPTEVQPGAKSEIKLKFDSHNRPGEVFKAATVTTDDPNQATYRLTFQGKVTMDFEVKERMVDFGDVEVGNGATKRFTIVSSAAEPPVIADVTAEDKRITVTKIEEKAAEGKPGKEYTFEVSLPKDFPPSDLFTQLKVHSNHPTKPELSVPLRARVMGEFIPQPAQIFALMAKGETVERPVILTARKAKSFTIEKVDGDPTIPATFRVEDMPQASMKKVIGSFSGADAQGRVDGKITVHVKTDDGRLVDVVVPVVTMTRPAMPNRAQMLPNKPAEGTVQVPANMPAAATPAAAVTAPGATPAAPAAAPAEGAAKPQ